MSYGAGDSPTYYIDITPFLGSLTDDRTHNLSIGVVGMGFQYSINSNWLVSGNVQIMLNPLSDERTTGEIVAYDASQLVTPGVKGFVSESRGNVTLDVSTVAQRSLGISAIIRPASGEVQTLEWSQQHSVSANFSS